jgi:hypothetical protein
VFSNRARVFRKSISQVPFLAAHHRVSDAALHTRLSNAHKYPAAVLALAAAAVAVAPLTASAATTTHTAAAKPAAATAKTAAKPAAAAKSTTAAKTASTTQTSTKAQAAAKPAAAAAPQTKAAAPAAPFAGTTLSALEPTGTEGGQEHFSLNSSQWSNATAIVNAANDLGMSPYAATIAVATAMQESTLRNLTVAVDHDSLGLFQQRPSMGWGSASELEDPTYAAKAFLRELPSDYQSMGLSDAAQSVQRSFDGALYAQWEDQAAHVVYTIANG